MTDNNFCCVCGVKLRQNYELDFLGSVCSVCFRMSKKKYIELVDKMAQKKIDFILDECKKIKQKIINS